MSCSIVWLRRDLRLHDHEPLARALDAGGRVVPIYCLDPREFTTTRLGFPKTGPFRGRFLLEGLAELRSDLRERGADLVVRHGRPEDVLPDLARQCAASRVFAHAEICDEELRIERAVQRALAADGVAFERSWGHSMLHPDDLPFAPADVPDVFTRFRRAVEDTVRVRPVLPAPARFPPLPDGLDPGPIPCLIDLGLVEPESDPRTVLDFRGGETAALARLEHYLWATDHVARYEHTRNGLVGADYSTKFSPWLAQGSLSPRLVHAEIRRYERERIRNDSTYWVIFELLWRDWFRFVAERDGSTLFHPKGPRGVHREWNHDREIFAAWIDGRTGNAFVDANMRELARTGFMSNRGRQNVASHLAHDLGVDWTWGAQWFESALIDYDVHSNWGNWAYVAGVGHDPRPGRRFDTRWQARKYDPDGRYRDLWS